MKRKEKIIENDFELNVIKTRKRYSKAKAIKKEEKKVAKDNSKLRMTFRYATVCTTFLK